MDLKASLSASISGKYESNQICFRKENNSNKDICRDLKALVGEIQFEYETELLFGEKYYFFIRSTGCDGSCSAESNLTEYTLCLFNNFYFL